MILFGLGVGEIRSDSVVSNATGGAYSENEGPEQNPPNAHGAVLVAQKVVLGELRNDWRNGNLNIPPLAEDRRVDRHVLPLDLELHGQRTEPIGNVTLFPSLVYQLINMFGEVPTDQP
jgi:hypothetical protein